MPVKLRSADLEAATSRLKLPPRRAPYRLRVAPGVALGYRRGRDFGTWNVIVTNGAGAEQVMRFGLADDREKADGKHVFSFDQAMAQARTIARGDDETSSEPNKAPKTIERALDEYRDDLRSRQASVYNATTPRFHLTPLLLTKEVNVVTADELRRWRDGLLRKGLKPASVNRVRNSLRAALELAAPNRSHVWKQGLQALPNAQRARKLIYSDTVIRALVAEAYKLDRKLGLFFDVLATTGTRPVQAARLRVEDLIADTKRPRLMLSKSAKGGGRRRCERKLEHYPVPVTPELAKKLKAAAAGRPDDEALLLQTNGKPFNEADVSRNYRHAWKEIAKAAGVPPGVTPYVFRHSSIARCLLHGLPVKITAGLHDTSAEQIESNYGKYLTEHADDVARNALLSHDEAAPADNADNVVLIGSR